MVFDHYLYYKTEKNDKRPKQHPPIFTQISWYVIQSITEPFLILILDSVNRVRRSVADLEGCGGRVPSFSPICFSFMQFSVKMCQIRMHSSRMRTARFRGCHLMSAGDLCPLSQTPHFTDTLYGQRPPTSQRSTGKGTPSPRQKRPDRHPGHRFSPKGTWDQKLMPLEGTQDQAARQEVISYRDWIMWTGKQV